MSRIKRRCKHCSTEYRVDARDLLRLADDVRDGIEPGRHLQSFLDKHEPVAGPERNHAERTFRLGWLDGTARRVLLELDGNCKNCALTLAISERAERRA